MPTFSAGTFRRTPPRVSGAESSARSAAESAGRSCRAAAGKARGRAHERLGRLRRGGLRTARMEDGRLRFDHRRRRRQHEGEKGRQHVRHYCRRKSQRPFRYSPSGQSSETGWSGPAPCRAASANGTRASTLAEKTIFWKRSASTRPEHEQVRSQPARSDEAHRQAVDVLVSARRALDVGPLLRERRRIAHDDVPPLARRDAAPQVIEDVGLQKVRLVDRESRWPADSRGPARAPPPKNRRPPRASPRRRAPRPKTRRSRRRG